MENNQKWSQAKPKNFIAQLLVDVETQIIRHFKPEKELFPTANWQGNQSEGNAGKKRLTMENSRQWSKAKPKKFIAQLLVDIETQIIPHFKPETQLYLIPNW